MFKNIVVGALVLIVFVILSLNQPNNSTTAHLIAIGLGVFVFIYGCAVTAPYAQGVGSQADYDNAAKYSFALFCFGLVAFIIAHFFGSPWIIGLTASVAGGLMCIFMVAT